MNNMDRKKEIVAQAKKLNVFRNSNLAEHEVVYPNPSAEFEKYGITPPPELLWLYEEIVCCRDSNHEGGTTRFLPIDEMARFPEDIQKGFYPFYDQLNFCWTLYVKSDEIDHSKVYCEYEAAENIILKLDFEDSVEDFLEKVSGGQDIFSEVSRIISKIHPRIKL